MRLYDQVAQLRRLDALIRRGATGSPDELARKLSVSRASVFRYLDELRAFGAPVYYNKQRRSYCYKGTFSLEI